MKRILVVGSLNMDLTVHTPRLPRLGETVTGSDFAASPGGKGANQAVAAAKLGGNVGMIGGVGRDVYAPRLCDNLHAAGVDTAGIIPFDAATGVAVITVCGGDNHIILDPGANHRLTPADLTARRELFARADLVLLQLEIPLDTVTAAARLARDCGAKVLLNPAPFQPLPDELLALTDVFVPNQHEAAGLVGRPADMPAQALDAARELIARGAGQVIVTLGEKGCVWCDGQAAFAAGVYPVDTVDTTAAGDCFIGAYAVAISEGKSPRQAVRFASAASAVTVSRAGASVSLPTRSEAEALAARPLAFAEL